MKVPGKYYDEVFDFKGQWEIPSKCGLKIIKQGAKTVVIATELYQDNPGTSVTYAGYALFRQICAGRGLSEGEVTYLECNPDTNSKLSFYDEEYFEVTFPEATGGSGRAAYRQLSPDEIKKLFT
ncbi:MAG: hypothetical protein LBL57_08555 [Tannerella sp.]|jgi:hypothetical protein|nr:hypothetical protein [Tannerella sp.]